MVYILFVVCMTVVLLFRMLTLAINFELYKIEISYILRFLHTTVKPQKVLVKIGPRSRARNH